MTLATSVLIPKPIPTEELFQFIRRDLLGATDQPYEQKRTDSDERWSSYNVGLPAWVEVRFRPDGPLLDEDGWQPKEGGPFFVEVFLDTTLGYENDKGGQCNDLHAWLVACIGGWLIDHGCDRWWWFDEFNADWYTQDVLPDGVLGSIEKGMVT